MSLDASVTVLVLSASQDESNLDQANFLSTMTANISMLQELGVANVSCGKFVTRSYAQVKYNSSGGEHKLTWRESVGL